MAPHPTVLIVVTSHGSFGASGKKTGYWLSEVTHFHAAIASRGLAADIASPEGGLPPMDERSRAPKDSINAAFLGDDALRKKLENSLPAASVDAGRYAAIYFAGGHGAMWDFPDHPALNAIASAIYQRGGFVCAVCHGPAGLFGVKDLSGKPLIEGRRVTGFSNLEERLIGLTQAVPFLLESRLRKAGGRYHRGFLPFVLHLEEDGRLLTGQNPASAGALGHRLAERLAPSGDIALTAGI